MKILITGGNSAKALKLLKAFEKSEIVFSDYGDMPIFKTAQYKFISLGFKDEITTAHQLLKICLDENINIVLPLQMFEIEALAKANALFEEFNILVLSPSLNQISSFDNTTEKLNDIIVVKNGNLIYCSKDDFDSNIFVSQNILNGVFSFTGNKLFLFKI